MLIVCTYWQVTWLRTLWKWGIYCKEIDDGLLKSYKLLILSLKFWLLCETSYKWCCLCCMYITTVFSQCLFSDISGFITHFPCRMWVNPIPACYKIQSGNFSTILIFSSSRLFSQSFVFSRSYCYTLWSAIGVILSFICPSVCLWRCAFWLSGLVYRTKSCISGRLQTTQKSKTDTDN